MAEWQYLGEGRHRSVWRHGNYVIKLPLGQDGIHANYQEAYTWNKYGYDGGCIKYARCRLLGDILVMQFANCCVAGITDENGYVHLNTITDLLKVEWPLLVDLWQVGYNRFGQLVAYDYGD
jgi:hypothetical protein